MDRPGRYLTFSLANLHYIHLCYASALRDALLYLNSWPKHSCFLSFFFFPWLRIFIIRKPHPVPNPMSFAVTPWAPKFHHIHESLTQCLVVELVNVQSSAPCGEPSGVSPNHRIVHGH